ncbi:hypothetical protein HMI55_005395 [Coelomomyces lativittatus]|nr:hypothetical protein HMI55_005395 [Coelomomyces lativittatus]
MKEEPKKNHGSASKTSSSNLLSPSTTSLFTSGHVPIRNAPTHLQSPCNSIDGTLMVDVTEMAVWTIVGTEKQEYSMYLPQVPPSLPEMPQLTSLTISLNGKLSNENTVLSLTGVYFYPGLSLYLADVPCHTEWHSQTHGHITLPLDNAIFRSLFGDSPMEGTEMSLSSHYPHFIVRKDTVIRKDRLVCLEPMVENINWCNPPSLLLPMVLVDTTGVIYETGWSYFLRLDDKVLGSGNIVVVE